MLKKSIAALTAILMIAAVGTASAFATTPTPIGGNDADGLIFFVLDEEGDHIYAGDTDPEPSQDPQHHVASATYNAGTVSIVFNTGQVYLPSLDADGNYIGIQPYWSAITADQGTLTGGYGDATQTLVYEQETATAYVSITFGAAFTPTDPDATYEPSFTHTTETYDVNVNPNS